MLEHTWLVLEIYFFMNYRNNKIKKYSNSFVLNENQHKKLHRHLHSGDGFESAAIILCHHGKMKSNIRFIANDIILIPNDACTKRTASQLVWPFADYLPPGKITKIDNSGLSIVTIHSHPNGADEFSSTDDDNDKQLFHSVCNWFDDDRPNGAAIMMADGEIVSRLVNVRGKFTPIESTSVVGENIRIWKRHKNQARPLKSGLRISQTFGKGTFSLLRNLRVGVVGCSGTGSVVVELLARNCIGELVIVDPDVVEEKNLNRIINATHTDARKGVAKVAVLKRAIKKMGTGVYVEGHQADTTDPKVIEALTGCDVIFGCVDSAEGRYHLECMASAYWLPYFDIGVNLQSDSNGKISQADAVAHYMHPENSNLMSRGGYTTEQVTAETWHRTDPEYYEKQRIAGYLAAVGEDQPAVMSINMQAACLAFNDFLARLHGFRLDRNDDFAVQRFRFVHGHYENKQESGKSVSVFSKYTGMGERSFLMKKLKSHAN